MAALAIRSFMDISKHKKTGARPVANSGWALGVEASTPLLVDRLDQNAAHCKRGVYQTPNRVLSVANRSMARTNSALIPGSDKACPARPTKVSFACGHCCASV